MMNGSRSRAILTRLARALYLCGSLLIATSSAGCIGFVGPDLPKPATIGTNAVGVTTMTVNDPSRDRLLTVEVWYPASARSAAIDDDDDGIYSVGALGGTVARLHSPTGAHRDVEPRREGGPFPVVLMSHGSGSTRLGNLTLCEVLASHGYIVAAPDHDGHTIDDQMLGISDDQRAQMTLARPLDLSRVLDALEARSSSPRGLLSGLVDGRRVAVAGHSFGGTTALGMVGAQFDAPRQQKECEAGSTDRLCRVVPVLGPGPYRYRDPRIGAAVLIAPGGYDLYRADGVAQVDAPTLVVAGLKDEGNKFSEYAKPIYDALKTPRHMLLLEDAGHLTATDICEIVDSIGFLAKAAGGKDAVDGCGGESAGFISTRTANDLAARAILAFFDRYLNENPSADAELQASLAPGMGRIRKPSHDLASVSAR